MAATRTKPAKGNPKKFDDTNRGVLFVNDKGDNDARPDFTGKLTIDPNAFDTDEDGMIQLRLAAWKKEGNIGEYLSISASEPKQ